METLLDRMREAVHTAATERTQLGDQEVALGTIGSFELAGVRFPATEVVFGLGEDGLFSDAQTIGNIGVDLLRAFRIVFIAKPGQAS